MISQKDCLDSIYEGTCLVCKESIDVLSKEQIYILGIADRYGSTAASISTFWHQDRITPRAVLFHQTCFTLMAGSDYNFDIPEKK